MEAFKIIYTVLGGLGIFFYGMKIMSDSLQATAGDVIKNVINSLTKNRVFAVLVGISVTAIVQSSSVTTVMTIGFVNAGLMSLAQAIGVIFGANIGTTVTGWIISIKIGKYGLLLIGLGVFPALFGKSNRWKHFGYVLLGMGMIFFGLEIMSNAFRPLRSMPEFISAIQYFSGKHYGAYIASVLVGAILTAIIQSSSAMLGIVIAMASTGVIEFQTGVAIVLGTNIGTTITAVLAAVGGNTHSKRAAKAHAIFNLLGVVLIMTVFPFFLGLVDSMVPGSPYTPAASGDFPYAAVHIASAHTMFNVVATLVALPFLNHLASLVIKITPDKTIREQHHLVVLGNVSELLPATAIIQANTELMKMEDIVGRMFRVAKEYVSSPEDDARTLAKVKDYERITDNIQKEITVFICKMMEKPLSPSQSREAQAIVRIADELESVGDYIDKLITNKTRFNVNCKFTGEAQRGVLELFDHVEEFYKSVGKGLTAPESFDLTLATRTMEELRLLCDSTRDGHLERVSKGEYDSMTAMTYSDMVTSLKKIRSHIYNISQSIDRSTQSESV
ncbi:MAG: Na/Pi cotransporter family protein [Bacteriovoracaceae bacterium]|nr:Na/Pi cotransporter family protein [Bacteriovoracaceae bacterium]